MLPTQSTDSSPEDDNPTQVKTADVEKFDFQGRRHPSWCDRNQCTAFEGESGLHRGTPIRISTALVGDASFGVQLFSTDEELIEEAMPAVRFTISRTDDSFADSHTFNVEPYQIIALNEVLAPMVALFRAMPQIMEQRKALVYTTSRGLPG